MESIANRVKDRKQAKIKNDGNKRTVPLNSSTSSIKSPANKKLELDGNFLKYN